VRSVALPEFHGNLQGSRRGNDDQCAVLVNDVEIVNASSTEL
jgi:hypothetical protein